MPGSFCSVTVKVCDWPTSLVASGAIAIFALTNVLTASPLFSIRPSVWTVNVVGGVPIVSVELACAGDLAGRCSR